MVRDRHSTFLDKATRKGPSVRIIESSSRAIRPRTTPYVTQVLARVTGLRCLYLSRYEAMPKLDDCPHKLERYGRWCAKTILPSNEVAIESGLR